jgi:hypothetical protein
MFESFAGDKHNSLFGFFVSDREKGFIAFTPDNSVIKLFYLSPMMETSKLERLPMASLSSLVRSLFKRDYGLTCKLANTKLGWKGLPVTNTLSYLAFLSVTEKRLYTIGT